MKFLVLLMAVALVACASVPPEKLQTLKPGMTRQEIVDDLGPPVETHFVSGRYVLTYNFGVNNAYELWFDGKDELYKWKPLYRLRRPYTPSGGVVTVIN